MNNKIFSPLTKIPIESKEISNFLVMINDRWRNKFYADALCSAAKDKVVLDVGTGTGILSAYALQAGAKFVFAVENNAEYAKIAQYTLSRCFDQSRFKVINCDFWSDQIDGQIDREIDILVSETVGPDLFDQGMCSTWHCAKPFLASNAISIPDRLHCDVHVWNEIIHIPRRSRPWTENDSETHLYPAELLIDNFAAALVEYDQIQHAAAGIRIRLKQTNFKLYNMMPDVIHTDLIDITKNTLPLLEFGKYDYPDHVMAKIEFSLNIDTPKTIGILNKISYLNNTLFLQDAMYMPWKYSPYLHCTLPGTYTFTFDRIRGGWHYNIITK
jgi:SAM-dependent methyltransferase